MHYILFITLGKISRLTSLDPLLPEDWVVYFIQALIVVHGGTEVGQVPCACVTSLTGLELVIITPVRRGICGVVKLHHIDVWPLTGHDVHISTALWEWPHFGCIQTNINCYRFSSFGKELTLYEYICNHNKYKSLFTMYHKLNTFYR